ncbi:MAG: hypothetical protein JXA57_12220 [Armatimonadetes bacterium]|nr:hypothetical protein [Armatimonadota bacterium]
MTRGTKTVASESMPGDSTRELGWLIIVCMAITVVLRDWNLWVWTLPVPGTFWVLLVVPVLPALLVLATSTFGRSIGPSSFRLGTLPVLLAVWLAFVLFFSKTAGGITSRSNVVALAVGMMAMTYAGYRCAASVERAIWLLDRLAWLTAALSTLSLLLLFVGRYHAAGGFWGSGSGPQTVFGAANGGVQVFLIFGCCWFGVQLLGLQKRPLSASLGLVLCAYDFLALTKSTVFSLVGGFLVATVLLLFVSQPVRSRVSRRALAVLLLAGVGLYGLNRVSSGRILAYAGDRYLHLESVDLSGIGTIGLLNSSSTGRTTIIWPAVWERFLESPWFGGGFGQVFRYDASVSVPTHNGFLELLMGVGAVGVLPVFIGHVWWLKTVLPSLRNQRVALVQVALLSYVAAEMVSLVGGVYAYWSPLLMYALALGVSMRLAVENSRKLGRLEYVLPYLAARDDLG